MLEFFESSGCNVFSPRFLRWAQNLIFLQPPISPDSGTRRTSQWLTTPIDTAVILSLFEAQYSAYACGHHSEARQGVAQQTVTPSSWSAHEVGPFRPSALLAKKLRSSTVTSTGALNVMGWRPLIRAWTVQEAPEVMPTKRRGARSLASGVNLACIHAYSLKPQTPFAQGLTSHTRSSMSTILCCLSSANEVIFQSTDMAPQVSWV